MHWLHHSPHPLHSVRHSTSIHLYPTQTYHTSQPAPLYFCGLHRPTTPPLPVGNSARETLHIRHKGVSTPSVKVCSTTSLCGESPAEPPPLPRFPCGYTMTGSWGPGPSVSCMMPPSAVPSWLKR